MPKRIVVDTSVARSAGDEDAVAEVAQHCRDSLLAIRERQLSVVTTEAVREEWYRHRSRFARRWMHSMYSRRLTAEVDIDPTHHLVAVIAGLLVNMPKESAAVAKDQFLLDAGFKTDSRVLSRDRLTRDILRQHCASVKPLREFFWAEPGENCIQWLTQGAPDSHEFRVCPLVDAAS